MYVTGSMRYIMSLLATDRTEEQIEEIIDAKGYQNLILRNLGVALGRGGYSVRSCGEMFADSRQ